ncbi:superoxide dismutase, Fe-Mn family [Monoraphidium neglectum]|uniref:superoxide dismutase n=1 Tax=Monoraphidium neglectum TaxID=145388 RepID=A0A0D2N371_9CHLO|nr:superoxide dismutase, Fe-Mn family [Monoraphidium neglectum]KIZ00576.1 superoxide dismutase, Fe-Mn family [Monoraphidium neglectum]|eukprot:XP_013899595.1 superoxide dismutase, Fe-Mn family [Monoraphidium neglectum]
MKVTLCLAVMAVLLAAAQAFERVKLPVELNGLEPVISNKTMNFHYNRRHRKGAAEAGRAAFVALLLSHAAAAQPRARAAATAAPGPHYATFITNLNALNNTKQSLTVAIKAVGKTTPINNVIRNSGGGAWNHAIKKAFPNGGFEALKKNVSDAAVGVFGSGWAWLGVLPGGGLAVTTTANQDNPLMGTAVTKALDVIPILGIDVWEHAYYVDQGPARKTYVDAYWSVLSWPQVSKNYASAVAGKVEEIAA